MLEQLVDGKVSVRTIIRKAILTSEEVDPDQDLGSDNTIHVLIGSGIKGADIVTLFSSVCNRNVVSFIVVVRCMQLGIMHESTVKHYINNPNDDIFITELTEKLVAKVPTFKGL